MKQLVKALLPYATKRAFKKGSILLYQGEAPRMAYAVIKGVIKVYSINNAGEEQIVTLHGDNDIFPGPWIFGKATTTQYYYETASDCEVITVLRDTLNEVLRRPQHIQAALDYFVTNYTGLLMRVTALEQSRAREKIIFTLYYLLFRYGKETKPDRYTLQVPLTHSVIASLVGLTRETTTAELNKLKQQKIVQYGRRTYIVSKQRLERILGEDGFQELELTI